MSWKFKDELNDEVAFQFVGLKSKMYLMKSCKEEQRGIYKTRNKKSYAIKITSIANQSSNHLCSAKEDWAAVASIIHIHNAAK